MNSGTDIRPWRRMGCPIRIFPDQRLLGTSPRLFASCYVLLRLFVSRHPPFTLECAQPLKSIKQLLLARETFLGVSRDLMLVSIKLNC